MSRILVTGAAGFMGSHLSTYLAKEGHEVYGIDNLSLGLFDNVPKTIKFAQMDMRNAEDVASVVDECKPEIIYHLAAWAHEGLSQFMPRLITENNYDTFLNLMVPAINVGTLKRIVVFSSMSVYGAQKPPFSEDMPTKPEDVYAIAKAAMEKCVEVLADVHGFEYTIIRPHNVYGPKQALHDPYRNVVGIFMNRIMKGLPPIIYGNGKQKRAFTYIDDVTPYVAKAGFLDNTNKQIINVGPTEEYTINELARIVLKSFTSALLPVHVEDRPREVKEAFSTNQRAKDLLGYSTSVTIEEGVNKMAEWAKQIGPTDFKYLDSLELQGDKVPTTWKNKMI